jgi:hypothetical protein
MAFAASMATSKVTPFSANTELADAHRNPGADDGQCTRTAQPLSASASRTIVSATLAHSSAKSSALFSAIVFYAISHNPAGYSVTRRFW